MNTTFKSSTYSTAEVAAITQRARKLSTLNHGDLAVALARLEYEVRRQAEALCKADNVSEDQLAEAEQQVIAAGQRVSAAITTIDVLVQP